MSQGQQQRRSPQQEPIKYGDVFDIQGELADKPVAPRDAAMMQTAENVLLGQVQRGGAAAMMQSAATRNEQAGAVGHGTMNEEAARHGVTVTKEDFTGHRVITESVGGQVVGQYRQPAPLVAGGAPAAGDQKGRGGSGDGAEDPITIGEALEATTLTLGHKPVERSDAAAIQAAEVRATGRTTIIPGGVAAAAQSAAILNARVARDEDKTKLADVLADASSKLPSDKPATRQDAEGVTGAEMRNDPYLTTHPAGVAASVAAAARLNETDQQDK
ncbi:late embryogenesis abundant protein D-34-like [Punica granatum]|uniref:SMP domain-containing protein n=2 Tax=Punica granatum TaxID=22663 RepID=A0A218XCB4_PUNGR|nr:late embryogenesis abundant protein D-34-like [Punica granatum]OWM82002.1 hypothetical protein CDL15_Pgr001575 [Punica granatum]PKI31162.1 hypothetical protein CRG98_048449 [Punica granatum]